MSTGCTNSIFVSGGGRVPGSAVIRKYEICSGKYQLPTLIIIDLWVVYGMGFLAGSDNNHASRIITSDPESDNTTHLSLPAWHLVATLVALAGFLMLDFCSYIPPYYWCRSGIPVMNFYDIPL